MPEELLADNKQDPSKLYTELASLPTGGLTALQIICGKLKFPLFKQELIISNLVIRKNVLVTAGAGGVGGFCLQLLREWRNNLPENIKNVTHIITTCSSPNVEYVKKLGATDVIDYNTDNVSGKIKQITNGNGLDVWIDLVGTKSVEQGNTFLRPGPASQPHSHLLRGGPSPSLSLSLPLGHQNSVSADGGSDKGDKFLQ